MVTTYRTCASPGVCPFRWSPSPVTYSELSPVTQLVSFFRRSGSPCDFGRMSPDPEGPSETHLRPPYHLRDGTWFSRAERVSPRRVSSFFQWSLVPVVQSELSPVVPSVPLFHPSVSPSDFRRVPVGLEGPLETKSGPPKHFREGTWVQQTECVSP